MSHVTLAERYAAGATLSQLALENKLGRDAIARRILMQGGSLRTRGRPLGAYNGHLGEAIEPSDEPERRREAKRASDALLRRLLAYGVKHGLPNLSTVECQQRLRAL
jgi:hypothetical protein